MENKFIEGHWYRWIGDKTRRPEEFNDEGQMDFLLDGKSHLCIHTRLREDGSRYATFADDRHEWFFCPETVEQFFDGRTQGELP